MKEIKRITLLITISFPLLLQAQDAQSVLKAMQDKQQQRWEGVDNYTIVTSLPDAMGMEVPIYNEKIEIEGATTFRQIPQPIYERDMQIQAGFPPPEETSAQMAEALKISKPVLDRGMFRLDWDGMIAFAEAGGEAYDHISDGTSEASSDVRDMKALVDRARLVGVESIVATSEQGGTAKTREAYHIVVDDLSGLDVQQIDESSEFRMTAASWWIDKEQYVPLAFEMQGEMERDGNAVPITIAGKHLDYKQVESLYEAFTKSFQISGLMEGMSKKDQKDMEKAKAELAKAKAEMEKMSPEQQAMMKRMMGNRFEEMEKMLAGDMFESTVKVVSIAINEGPPTQYGLGSVDNQPALTQLIEEVDAAGSLVAQLDIRVGPLAERGELAIRLIADSPVPFAGETLSIKSATGYIVHNGTKVQVTGAQGSIKVDYRSETHISGTYQVDMTFAGGVLPTINGIFKSPPPRGPGDAPFGSPIPAGLFSGPE